jgi:phage host-nuclease inhibitor protein Gam
MGRVKPKNLYPIKDLAAANAAMAEIAGIKRSIAEIESAMNERIDHTKAEAEVRALPLQARLASIEGGLLAYAEHNKSDLFKDKRSRELDFGSLGYRRSKEIKPKAKTTWKMVLGAIKQFKFNAALRTTEGVNKEELHTWPDQRLDVIGCHRVEKDTFWYEIDETKIAEKAV